MQKALIQNKSLTHATEQAGDIIDSLDNYSDVKTSKVRRICGDNCRRFGTHKLKEDNRCETSIKTIWLSSYAVGDLFSEKWKNNNQLSYNRN